MTTPRNLCYNLYIIKKGRAIENSNNTKSKVLRVIALLLVFAGAGAILWRMWKFGSDIYMLSCSIATLLAAIFIVMSFSRNKPRGADKISELSREFANASAKSAIVINTINDGVAIVDQHGIIQLFNPAAANIIGWKIADVTNLDYRSVFKVFNAADQELIDDNPVTTALKSNTEFVSDDLSLETTSQKRVQVHLHVTPISKTDGVIVTFRDITAAKREEHEQAEFISTASHEMRTPIAIIEGYLGMLMNPATATLDARGMEFASKAHASAQQLGRLFQDLLDVTTADDGRQPNDPTLLDAAAIAKQVVGEFSPQAVAKNLSLTYDSGTGMQPVYVIYLDLSHLREILNNIVENAIKYTQTGSIVVKVSGDNDRVRFSVTDTGIGIPAEDVSHLFQKFYRVDNTDTREIGGTGLGLYLTKKLTEQMGGKIGVESTLGQGSTFWVEFDRLSRDQAMQKAEEVKKRVAAEDKQK